MRISPGKSADDRLVLLYGPEHHEIPVTFSAITAPQYASADEAFQCLSQICQDDRFVAWASMYAPSGQPPRPKLLALTFEEVELREKATACPGRLRFTAEIQTAEGSRRPVPVTLSASPAALLIVLRLNPPPEQQQQQQQQTVGGATLRPREFVLFMRRPEWVIGTPDFLAIPQGTIDESGAFVGPAAELLKEEGGLETIREHQLVDMTSLAFPRRAAGTQRTVAISPCSLGDRVRLYLYRENTTQAEIGRLQALARQQRGGGEGQCGELGLELCPLNDAWRMTADAISLAALLLLHELRYHALMPKYRPPREPKKQPTYALVEELDPNKNGYNLRIRVVGPAETGNGKDFYVGDASGVVKLRLNPVQRTDYQGLITPDTPLILRNVNLDMAGGRIAVVMDRFSKLDQPSSQDEIGTVFNFQPNMANDVSAPEYEEKVIDPGQLSPQLPPLMSRVAGRGGRGGGLRGRGRRPF